MESGKILADGSAKELCGDDRGSRGGIPKIIEEDKLYY